MKTILIPTEDHDAMLAVLEAARLTARILDSYMEGFAVCPSTGTYVTVEPVSSLAISAAYETDAGNLARSLFESVMRHHSVPPVAQEPAVYSYNWPWSEVKEDAFIGSYGRVFDLIVLGRPGPASQNPRMAPLKAALFNSGRPALVIPPSMPQTFARNILVAWNGSIEQARANTFALPLLCLADKVTVLTVEDTTTLRPSADEVAHYLYRNGVKTTAVTVKPGTRTTGEIILDHATSLGCDLLVKGAYTHSRLRQMIFGRATQYILSNATLPIFMAH